MAREEGIKTTGRIVEILGEDRYRAALPNGKIVFAFPSRELRENPSRRFAVDDLVTLRLTPYDFSKAEIRGKALGGSEK